MKNLPFILACAAGVIMAPPLYGSQDETIEPHATDIVIGGGPVFMAWPETDSFMTCGLTIYAPTQRHERRKPIQLMLLVDVSRAMQGEPLGSAKKAAKAVIETLKEGDMFGLAAFSTYGRAVFPMQALSAGVKPSAHSAASGLGDEDLRNTLEGIQRGLEQFDRLKGQDVLGRHLFLITNGDANTGMTARSKVLEKALAMAAERGVSISTFGFRYFDRGGDNFDEDFLYALAYKTRGRYYFIDNPDDIAPRVIEETDRVCSASARQVRLEISPPGRSSRIVNIEGGIREEDGRIFVGDMAAATMRMVVFDIEGRPRRQTDCEVRATWTEPDGVTEREVRAYIDIALVSGATRLNPKTAGRIIVYDLQASLAETSGQIAANRREYAMVFKDKIKDLEQENVILASDYVRQALAYYERFERVLSNSAVDNTVVVKHIKYRMQQILYGK